MALERDRDQLWAEASRRLAQGETYELPEELWAEAARVQHDKTLTSPMQEKLEVALEGRCGSIDTEDVYSFLELKNRHDRYTAAQVRKCMENLGWTKCRRRRGKIQLHCYTKGEGEWFDLHSWSSEGMPTNVPRMKPTERP